MQNRFVIIYLSIFITINICSEEVHKYKPELEYTFEIGSKNNSIGLLTGESTIGEYETQPTGIIFDGDNLVISDFINSRIIFLNKDYSTSKIIEDIDGFTINSFYHNESGIIVSSSYNKYFVVLNKIKANFMKFSFPSNISQRSNKAVYTDNVIFNYYEDGSICSYVLQGEASSEKMKLLSSQETMSLFIEPDKYGLLGYTIDDNKRIYLNGILQNRDYLTMYDYWKDMHNKFNEKKPRSVPGISEFENLHSLSDDIRFLGEDADGNTYWDITLSCIVFDKNGWPLDFFWLNDSLTSPAVNSDGDIYYLTEGIRDEKPVVNLYKIERQW